MNVHSIIDKYNVNEDNTFSKEDILNIANEIKNMERKIQGGVEAKKGARGNGCESTGGAVISRTSRGDHIGRRKRNEKPAQKEDNQREKVQYRPEVPVT